MRGVDREKQLAQAEEVLGDRLPGLGFAKGLFFGHYFNAKLPPYPDLLSDPRTNRAVADLEAFSQQEIDPVAIDRNAEIPDSVVRGLGWLGVLGACLPKEYGGGGFSQTAYCRLIEVLGGHCGSTALFVNAHHSIGPRALVLVRHARAAGPLAAENGQRRVDQRLCPDRARSRQRCRQCADHGHAHAGR